MRRKRKRKYNFHSVTKLDHVEEKQKMAIRMIHVSKHFFPKRNIWTRAFFLRRKKRTMFKALDDITFSVKKGECIGIIGLNGSGKSTLSNLIAGSLLETRGVIKRNGMVSLLAIHSGLKPNLTGLENIKLKLLLLGFKPVEIQKRIQKIKDFTELHDFLQQPLKHYSSGMKAKLGFGIAIQIDPDILIIDEALSVGDQTFYKKCLNEINRFKQEKKTIFFVSHAARQIREMCDRVAWMHYGKLKMWGESEEVCLAYSKFVHHFDNKTETERLVYQKEMSAKQFCPAEKVETKYAEPINGGSLCFFTSLVLLLIFSAWQMIKG